LFNIVIDPRDVPWAFMFVPYGGEDSPQASKMTAGGESPDKICKRTSFPEGEQRQQWPKLDPILTILDSQWGQFKAWHSLYSLRIVGDPELVERKN
jgi:hypothetical protein